jgi:hypothetical protein
LVGVGSSSGENGHDSKPTDFRGYERAFRALSDAQDQEATKDSKGNSEASKENLDPLLAISAGQA